MKILIGTKNKHKIIEIERIFKDIANDIDFLSLNDLQDIPEPIEDGKTFKDNAIIKAKYYYDIFKIPTITDDSGISVVALNNEPGILSARYASNNNENSTDKANRVKLLKNLENIIDREAFYTCCACFYDGDNLICEQGFMNGYILNEEVGTNGFGYDSIFYSYELDKPVGLAKDNEKDQISHRYKALKKLVSRINSQISTKF